MLLIVIALISLLLNLAHDIVKKLRVGKWFVGKSKAENAELQKQLEQAKANLESVKNGPSAGEYSLLIKTMRAEQKIKDIQEKMYGDRNMNRLKSASIELIAGYCLKIILFLVLLRYSIVYCYTPVLVYDDRFNFFPIGAILAFPTGVPNGLSTPIWSLSCNVAFSKIIGYIKRRK